jgi:hypothetical protein
MTKLSREQVDSITAFIDARIEEFMTRTSSGPHVSFNREHARLAKDDLYRSLSHD